MSHEYSSSNPFRRKATAPTSTASAVPPEIPSTITHFTYSQADPTTSFQSNPQSKKTQKKVRVQSPPPPSPSLPVSSTILDDVPAYSEPSKLIPRDDNPFSRAPSDTSEGDRLGKPSQAPPNPFQKTLETMEQSVREGTGPPKHINQGRASLDVEAFKRLLLTGNAGLGVSTLGTPPAHLHNRLGDGGSSTDASSISRHSMFEPIQGALPESPRTSHEISDLEDNLRGINTTSSTTGRMKPPPPSSRHGKLIKVELRDDSHVNTNALATQQPSTLGSANHQDYFGSSQPSMKRSPTDLNKPLPPAPDRAFHEFDIESVFDREAAGKAPEPPSPGGSMRRKTPPTPPLTRRHSQRVSDIKITRGDVGRLSPKVEEEPPKQRPASITSIEPISNGGRPRSDSGRVPPPPPSRRPGSLRNSSRQSSLPSSPVASQPPTLPAARGPTRSVSARERPPSVVMDIDLNKRASTIPPPPPPHRHGRSSMEGGASQRTSGDYSRSGDGLRRGSEASSIQQEGLSDRPDILADLSKLQKEIDALRARGVRESVT